MRHGLTRTIGALIIALAMTPSAQAFSDGITSSTFGAVGCPLCHVGGTPPTVVLSGPESVDPSSTVEFTVTIFGSPTQNLAGFNASVPIGVLSTGGPFAAGTQALPGLLGYAEITHTAPKQGDFLSVIEFSFLWTAPASFTSTTLRAWGNAVDGSASPSGDAATLATIDVSVSSGPPTPTAGAGTPTPTAPPFAAPCADAAPLEPPLITDAAAQACQAAIAKAGAVYLKKDHKAVRKCLTGVQKKGTSGDAVAECVGSATTLPGDADTAAAVVAAQAKALEILHEKCPDAALALLDACADTAAALPACFLTAHRQAVVDVVASQYGSVEPSSDGGLVKCQKAIGSAAAKHLVAYLRASQKCLVRRNADGLPPDGALECVGAVDDNAFAAPRNRKVSAAEATGADKLAAAIESKCSEAQIAALDTCGTDRATVVACLACAHRTAVFEVISSEFGGAP